VNHTHCITHTVSHTLNHTHCITHTVSHTLYHTHCIITQYPGMLSCTLYYKHPIITRYDLTLSHLPLSSHLSSRSIRRVYHTSFLITPSSHAIISLFCTSLSHRTLSSHSIRGVHHTHVFITLYHEGASHTIYHHTPSSHWRECVSYSPMIKYDDRVCVIHSYDTV